MLSQSLDFLYSLVLHGLQHLQDTEGKALGAAVWSYSTDSSSGLHAGFHGGSPTCGPLDTYK